MEREQAMALLKQNVKSEHLINHSVAVESIMIGLAEKFGQDKNKFALAGLLHDIDYDTTCEQPEKHSLVGAEILTKQGIEEDVIYAIKVHNMRHGLPRLSLMDKALYAADPMSGFITAAALIRPDKQINNVELKSLKKRFKEKSFAKGANREQMAACQELGLELEDFMQIALESMKKIAPELGI